MTAKNDWVPIKEYMRLVRKFPLTPIQNDAHVEAASKRLDYVLAFGEDDPGVVAYLDVLTDLVEVYESVHIDGGGGTPAGVLALMMAEHDLTQTQLAKEVGMQQATISNVLRGVRDFTGPQAVRLAARFHLDPGAFLSNETTPPRSRKKTSAAR